MADTSQPTSQPQTKRRRRTKCRDIEELKTKLVLQFNENGQPIGDRAKRFASYLGVLARKNRCCPLNVKEWRKMDDSKKHRLIKIIEKKFSYDISPDEFRRYVLMSIGKKWRQHRYRIRKKYFNPTLTNEQMFNRKPFYVDQKDWEEVIKYFRDTMGRAEKAKASRAKQKVLHTCGRKSFACVRKEMEEVKGSEVGPLELFNATHCRKGTNMLDEPAAIVVGEVKKKLTDMNLDQEMTREDLFILEHQLLDESLGPPRKGRVRGQGLGVTPSRMKAHATNVEIGALKRKLVDIEEERAVERARAEKLESLVMQMQIQMAEMQKKLENHGKKKKKTVVAE